MDDQTQQTIFENSEDVATNEAGLKDLLARVEHLETELAAAAQAFSIMQRGVILLSGLALRQTEALKVIGATIEGLAGAGTLAAESRAFYSKGAAEEIAELKKMFERGD